VQPQDGAPHLGLWAVQAATKANQWRRPRPSIKALALVEHHRSTQGRSIRSNQDLAVLLPLPPSVFATALQP